MVDRVVLDVQLADAEPLREPVGAHERREAGVQAGARLALDGQQFAVAPEARAGAAAIASRVDRLRDRRRSRSDLERPHALGADPAGTGPGRTVWHDVAAQLEVHGLIPVSAHAAVRRSVRIVCGSSEPRVDAAVERAAAAACRPGRARRSTAPRRSGTRRGSTGGRARGPRPARARTAARAGWCQRSRRASRSRRTRRCRARGRRAARAAG